MESWIGVSLARATESLPNLLSYKSCDDNLRHLYSYTLYGVDCAKKRHQAHVCNKPHLLLFANSTFTKYNLSSCYFNACVLCMRPCMEHQCPGKYRICFIFSTSHASSSKYHCHSCTWSKLQDPSYLSRAYGRGIQCCHLFITILNSLPQRLWLNYDLGTVRGIQTSIIQFLIWLVFSDFLSELTMYSYAMCMCIYIITHPRKVA